MTIENFSKALSVKFSQTVVVDEDGNIKINFPSTQDFIAQIEIKENTEKLYNILRNREKILREKSP